MNNRKMDDLRENYMNIKISDKLDDRVSQAIKKSKKINRRWINMKKSVIGVAASVAVVIGMLNVSPAFADALEEVPIVGNIIKLVVLKNYRVKDNNIEADINIAQIDGLKNKELQDNLNEEFMKEGKEAYENLLKEIPDIGEGRKYVGMDYNIKSETDSILSIELSKLEIQASGYETRKHYVIDKEKQVVLTLPLIFKDKSYVDVISDNIKEQMRKQMKEDEGKIYFLDSEEDFAEDDFKKIAENQDFYINSNNNLVICFDEYEVAPGYMGPVEFIIPKEIVNSLK